MRAFEAVGIMAFLMFVRGAAAEPQPLEPYKGCATRTAARDAPVDLVTLQEQWRFDCHGDADPVVGTIVSAAPASEGRVLLIDSQQCQVLVIAPGGGVERVVGRPGPGPGELTGAFRAAQLPPDRFGIADGCTAPGFKIGTRGSIVVLDAEGDPVGEFLAGGDPGSFPMCVLRELRNSGDELLAATHRSEVSPPLTVSVRELSVLDVRSGVREVIARTVHRADMRNQSIDEIDVYEAFAGGRCDISRSGRIALAPDRDRWSLAVRERDGSWSQVERPWTPVSRGPGERDRVRQEIGSLTGEVLSQEPAIGRVRWRPDGRLWVEPFGMDLPAGVMACFDELSADLTLVRRVHLALPDSSRRGELILMEDGRFVLLEGFAKDVAGGGDVAEPAVTLLTMPEP